MKNIELVMQPPQQVAIITGWTCDVCKTTYDVEDYLEIQEFHSINFTGGYGSVFGDMVKVECDICQYCLKEMIDGICRTRAIQ
jgi:hypothetical protein